MKMKLPAIIKMVGNVNRINEYKDAGWTPERTRQAFARNGVTLVVVAGDFPLIANQAELCRKAVSKAAVRADIDAGRDPQSDQDADSASLGLAAIATGKA